MEDTGAPNLILSLNTFFIKLVWSHLQFPNAAVKLTLIELRDNRDIDLISVNVLEFLTVSIDYCVAYTVITTEHVTEYPHPALLSMTDSTSAHSWTNHPCTNSMLGKSLAKCFCSLLMDYKLGVNSD